MAIINHLLVGIGIVVDFMVFAQRIFPATSRKTPPCLLSAVFMQKVNKETAFFRINFQRLQPNDALIPSKV
jgi:hypothetical protein